ncbi:hypothetical protein ACLO87_09535 [Paenalcaligenes sp. Me52]|uniref:hypothetical protein n=1 Tax=Paenalcaligenes sp. Me52 TaxID=3392038 RepID=UPI003D28E92F
MEKFCRERQKAILNAARQAFPEFHDCSEDIADMTAEEAIADIRYLEGHGLLKVQGPRYLNQMDWDVSIQITSEGIDFIEADGGLSAILGVVTVRLHDETIKNLIEAKILAADLPQPDKQRYIDELRKLPAESTKHLVMKLIDAGLTNAPAAWTAIQNALAPYL